jgi:hypothetical protein
MLLVAVLAPANSTARSTGGVSAPQALLQFTAGGHVLGFASEGMYAATSSHALHVKFAGTRGAQPAGDTASGKGGQVTPLNLVTYKDLWPGISLTYATTPQGVYTTTFTLTPSADPVDIHMLYNTPISLNDDGSLNIAFKTGTLTESAPIAWQEIQGKQIPVEVSFHIHGQELSFALGAHDPNFPLTIDPTLTWNTFLGDSGSDFVDAIALDGNGNIYLAGYSYAGWGCSPSTCTVRGYTAGGDAFIAKLSSTGSLLWNTFLGGDGDETGYGIAIDGNGNIYVGGSSSASWGSPVREYSASEDAYAAKVSPSGNLIWNTFLGGSGYDEGYDLALDGSWNVYVGGSSGAYWSCSDVPCTLRGYTANVDGYAAKLDSAGILIWNTFLGSSGIDQSMDITVDGSKNIYVAGISNADWGCSPVSCTVRGYSADSDAFVAKMSPLGILTWNTFLGGNGSDGSSAIMVDGSGNIYIGGFSGGTWGSPLRAYTAGSDAFAAKLGSTGSLTWNTFLGGVGDDYGQAVFVDGSGEVSESGVSNSTWGSPLRGYTGDLDAFAAKLSSGGSLSWNTFMGGSGEDQGLAIVQDGNGNIFLGGDSNAAWGCSPVGCTVRGYTSGYDGYVAKLSNLPGAFSKTSPTNGASGQPANPTLSWGTSSGATSYQYCIDTTNNNTCDTTWTSTGTNTSTALSGFSSGTYYWAVRSKNSNGTTVADKSTTPWWSFTVTSALPGAFSKTNPANGATGQPANPTLSWGTSNGATSYQYCIDTTNDSTCNTTWTSTGTSTSVALSGLSSGTYYWAARSKNAAGTVVANKFNGVPWWSFTVTSALPGVFSKISPANGATGQPSNPTLSWGASSGAVSYEFCIDMTNDNTCGASWISTGTNLSAALNSLIPGKYYWAVRAKNTAGTVVANKFNGLPWWSFTVP